MAERKIGIGMLLLSTQFFIGSQAQSVSSMRYALDGMQEMMEGEGVFDDDTYADIISCFEEFDSGLTLAQDAEWQGMIDFAQSEGYNYGRLSDTWMDCEDEDLGNGSGEYAEFNCTTQEKGGMPIYEPCDYASNIAYYHTMLEVCHREEWSMPYEYVLAFVRTYAYLAQGSAFFHGSETTLGHAADAKLTDLFAFVGYQAAVAGLEPMGNTILHDLSPVPRSKTAAETTADLQQIFTDHPVEEWTKALIDIDVPGTRLGMCAYLATGFSIFLEDEQLEAVAAFFINLLDMDDFRDGKYEMQFCQEVFIPELEKARQNITLTSEEKEEFVRGFLGIFIKLFYGAIWQETLLPDLPFLFTEAGNTLGTALLPLVNDFANRIMPSNDFPQYNPAFQHGFGVYPGESWCNPSAYPHAKWHLQMGIALADFAHMSDLMNRLLRTPSDNDAGSQMGSGAKQLVRQNVTFIAALAIIFQFKAL